MHFTGSMRAAEKNKHKPPLQFPPDRIGHPDMGNRSMGIGVHVDIADAAIGRAQLILDTALQTEPFSLHAMGEGSNFMGGQPARCLEIQCAEKGDANRGGRSRGASRRCVRKEIYFQTDIIGNVHNI